MVFDEHTNGLDRRHMEQTGQLISTLKDKKQYLLLHMIWNLFVSAVFGT